MASAAAAVCGNGIAETPEECDDGNASNADACLATCQRPVTWVTSDVHVHTTGCSQDVSPARLAEELKKQQIQVGAALVWGEGYATEAALACRDWAVGELGLKRLVSVIAPDNAASIRVAEKLGETLEREKLPGPFDRRVDLWSLGDRVVS